MWPHGPPDVHALCETVWGFLDTIPDITAIKVRLSLPASSSDYLTAGSGLQWLIPRQSLRLVQHTEKECTQRPDDENKNTCRGSRPKKDMPPSPRPSDVGYISADFTFWGSRFKIKCNFLSKSTSIPPSFQRRHHISHPTTGPGAGLRWLDRQTPKCCVSACQISPQ